MKPPKNGTRSSSKSKYFPTDPATFLFKLVLGKKRDWRLGEMDMIWWFMIMIRLSWWWLPILQRSDSVCIARSQELWCWRWPSWRCIAWRDCRRSSIRGVSRRMGRRRKCFQEWAPHRTGVRAIRATWEVPCHHWDSSLRGSHYTRPIDVGCGLLR